MINKNILKALLPQIGLLVAMVLWASSFIALKIAFRAYDPMVVIFGRMLVASLCLLIVGYRFRRAVTYQKGDYLLILFMAFCEPCLYFLFEAQALVYTTASQAGMITAILPVMVMISASLILKERTGVQGWLGALLAVAGVAWLTLESAPTENAPNPMLGNFLEFIAMICATGYMISLRYLTIRYSPFFLTAVQAFVGCIFYFPFLFLPSTELPRSFDLVPGLAVIYLGAAITLGAYGLYNYGLKYIPASKAAAYVNLIPVLSVLLGWIVLGEKFERNQIIAAFIIMTGVWLTQQRFAQGRAENQSVRGSFEDSA
ncbi:MAG: DMT family transporter [Desulfopila sp.]|jgi:drug/metabolite transporter (DMT)-like permease|nr:DMT family transporter [Desulfopila sp.]